MSEVAVKREKKLTKRFKEMKAQLKDQAYPINEAVELLKGFASGEKTKTKFDQSIDVSLTLGIDARKSDQGVRGSIVMPHGTGKKVRVAVFTQGANVEAAEQAGADRVGMDDLAEDVKKGNMDFDVVIASPDAMGIVGRLGQILGPRGLMPNPKVGTVTPDVAGAVKNAKSGQVQFRNDKAGILHCAIGKASFDTNAIQENLSALINEVKKHKPQGSKGVFLKKLTLSTTMGPGVKVDLTSLV